MRIVLIILILLGLLTACNTKPPGAIAYAALPESGDPVHGEQLFMIGANGAVSCVSCHNETGVASPNLDGFGQRAGTRVADQGAREYAFYSITEPWRYVVEGYGNAMPNDYDDKLSPQDIADIIAYLLTR